MGDPKILWAFARLATGERQRSKLRLRPRRIWPTRTRGTVRSASWPLAIALVLHVGVPLKAPTCRGRVRAQDRLVEEANIEAIICLQSDACFEALGIDWNAIRDRAVDRGVVMSRVAVRDFDHNDQARAPLLPAVATAGPALPPPSRAHPRERGRAFDIGADA